MMCVLYHESQGWCRYYFYCTVRYQRAIGPLGTNFSEIVIEVQTLSLNYTRQFCFKYAYPYTVTGMESELFLSLSFSLLSLLVSLL